MKTRAMLHCIRVGLRGAVAGLLLLALNGSSVAADDAQTRVFGNWLTQTKEVIIKGLKYEGEGKWSGGMLYKPDEGKIFKCKVELQANGMLKVRGFVGISLFG